MSAIAAPRASLLLHMQSVMLLYAVLWMSSQGAVALVASTCCDRLPRFPPLSPPVCEVLPRLHVEPLPVLVSQPVVPLSPSVLAGLPQLRQRLLNVFGRQLRVGGQHRLPVVEAVEEEGAPWGWWREGSSTTTAVSLRHLTLSAPVMAALLMPSGWPVWRRRSGERRRVGEELYPESSRGRQNVSGQLRGVRERRP
jgi:hypothetical protein